MAGEHVIIWAVVFLTAVMLLGGLVSLLLEFIYQKRNPKWREDLFHGTYWAKDLTIQPRHVLCSKCAEEVARIEELHARRTAARRS